MECILYKNTRPLRLTFHVLISIRGRIFIVFIEFVFVLKGQILIQFYRVGGSFKLKNPEKNSRSLKKFKRVKLAHYFNFKIAIFGKFSSRKWEFLKLKYSPFIYSPQKSLSLLHGCKITFN